jgi:hypothetical protein
LIHPNHVGLRPTPWHAHQDHNVAIVQTDLLNLEGHSRRHLVAQQVFDALLLLIDIDACPSWSCDRHAA